MLAVCNAAIRHMHRYVRNQTLKFADASVANIARSEASNVRSKLNIMFASQVGMFRSYARRKAP